MRKNRILWVEDDLYAIKGLIRPLQNEGFLFDIAESALEAYYKGQVWKSYDLIVVDLILPLSNDSEQVPSVVQSWESKGEYLGIEIVKWLLTGIKAECPVVILSVVRDPISRFNLRNVGVAGYLLKRGLLPSTVRDEVLGILEKNAA
jgi:CheY-like chemotaxis protein